MTGAVGFGFGGTTIGSGASGRSSTSNVVVGAGAGVSTGGACGTVTGTGTGTGTFTGGEERLGYAAHAALMTNVRVTNKMARSFFFAWKTRVRIVASFAPTIFATSAALCS